MVIAMADRSFLNLHETTCHSIRSDTVALKNKSVIVSGKRDELTKMKMVQPEISSDGSHIVFCKDESKSYPVDTVQSSGSLKSEINDDMECVYMRKNLESTAESGENCTVTSECPTPGAESKVNVIEYEETDLVGDHSTNAGDKDGPNFKGTDKNEIQMTKFDIPVHKIVTSKSTIPDAEKIDSLAKNMKVEYKAWKSCKSNLDLLFYSVLVLSNIINPNRNFMLSVFVSLDQNYSIPNGRFAVAPEHDLPNPDLPGIPVIHVGQRGSSQHGPSPESLGVNMRDTEQPATLSAQHEEIGSSVLTPEDSGLIGTRDRRSVQLQIPVYQRVAEETCLQWINIQYPEPTHTSGEENGRREGMAGRRTEDVPNLQTPLITDIALNEEQTERKVRQQRVLDLNAHDLTLLSPDGNPTTGDNRRRSAMVEQSPDANSVSPAPATPAITATPAAPTAECPYTYPGSMGDVQARANTFDRRWPHPHLSPRRMAEAGFFYTGEGDTARCFSCRKTLIKWEKEDDPFVEHSKHSPNCKYLQNVRKRLPQNFGACCGIREAQLDEVLETEDLPYESEETTEEQLGSYRYALREGDNGQQRLEMVPSNSDNEQVQGLGRPNPHAEQDQATLERHHSEALAGTEYNQHAESSGIQESRYQSSSTDLSARLLEHTYQSAEVHNGGDQIGMEAIDEDLFNYYLGTEEVGIVFSEGYSLEDISQVVAKILKAGRPVTMDLLRQELHNIGARRQI